VSDKGVMHICTRRHETFPQHRLAAC